MEPTSTRAQCHIMAHFHHPILRSTAGDFYPFLHQRQATPQIESQSGEEKKILLRR
jgi:hypothetical protein